MLVIPKRLGVDSCFSTTNPVSRHNSFARCPIRYTSQKSPTAASSRSPSVVPPIASQRTRRGLPSTFGRHSQRENQNRNGAASTSTTSPAPIVK